MHGSLFGQDKGKHTVTRVLKEEHHLYPVTDSVFVDKHFAHKTPEPYEIVFQINTRGLNKCSPSLS